MLFIIEYWIWSQIITFRFNSGRITYHIFPFRSFRSFGYHPDGYFEIFHFTGFVFTLVNISISFSRHFVNCVILDLSRYLLRNLFYWGN